MSIGTWISNIITFAPWVRRTSATPLPNPDEPPVTANTDPYQTGNVTIRDMNA